MNQYNKIICALDVEDFAAVKKIVKCLGADITFYKVGLKLFTQCGPKLVTWLKSKNKKVFLDLKLYDIPNTVAAAVSEAVALKVDMMTLHASGGPEMLRAAVRACNATAKKMRIKKPILLGVSVLTSMDDLAYLGLECSVEQHVARLAKLSFDCGLAGLVCSPLELVMLRSRYTAKQLKLVTPGIRPPGSDLGDQKRVMTPREAIRLGANYLVIGRPLYQTVGASAARLFI